MIKNFCSLTFSLNSYFKRLTCTYRQVRFDSSEVLYKLLRRGVFKEIFPNDHPINSPGKPCAYAGFDATADSLHIGNLLVLISLIHWQRAGYKVIAVIGNATTEIGDPSGHKDDRKILSRDVINNNAEFIEKSINTIFHNHEKFIWSRKEAKSKLGTFSILSNREWYHEKNAVDFISEAGRHMRVGDMLSRTSVKSRMENGSGINFCEFSYQAFQSFDWLWLLKKHNCRFQFGGSDQLGNIVTGYNLISGSMCQHVYGALIPLIQSESGDKFGKSAGNAVYLSSHKTSIFDLYQFFMRLADSEVEQFLRLFTFISLEEIEDIMKTQMKSPEVRYGQRRIAEEVTLLVHGEKGLKSAQTATKAIFNSDIESLSKLSLEEVKEIIPDSTITQIPLEPGLSMIDITMKVGCFLTEADANRILSSGGVYLNFKRISSPKAVLIPEHHILPNGTSLIRVGKKTYYLIIWR